MFKIFKKIVGSLLSTSLIVVLFPFVLLFMFFWAAVSFLPAIILILVVGKIFNQDPYNIFAVLLGVVFTVYFYKYTKVGRSIFGLIDLDKRVEQLEKVFNKFKINLN